MDRLVPTTGTGPVYMAALKTLIDKLFDVACIDLTDAAGTDTYTADLDPTLLSNLVDGMKFVFTVPNTNTGASTLSLNSGTAVSILRWDGTALQAGDLTAGQRILLDYQTISTVGKLLMLVPPPGAAGAKINRQVFTSSGTWTKPTGYSADSQVIVEAWAGGGGGSTSSNGGGGGGGAYVRREFKLSDLGATETATIGAGGAAGVTGTTGGNSTLGSLVTAYGGAGGAATQGGGGGGALAAGSSGAGGAPAGGAAGSSSAGIAADNGGGGGGNGGGNGGASFNGGGGGGGGSGGGSGGDGGASFTGGGGGGGNSTTSGGASKFGGAGGANGAAGTAPAGGGGRNAAGARGEIRITVIG